DTPRALIASLGGEHVIEFSLEVNGEPRPIGAENFANLPAVSSARQEDGHISLSVREPHVALPALLGRLDLLNCKLTDLTTRHASLEDVFVKLAGRHLMEAPDKGQS